MEGVREGKHKESHSDSFRNLLKSERDEERQLLDRMQTPFWRTQKREEGTEIRERLMKMNDENRLQTIKMVAELYDWSPKVHGIIVKAVGEHWKLGPEEDKELFQHIKTAYESKNALMSAGVSKNYALNILNENRYGYELKNVAEGLVKSEKNNLDVKAVVEHIAELKSDEAVKNFNENGIALPADFKEALKVLRDATKWSNRLDDLEKYALYNGPTNAMKVVNEIVEIAKRESPPQTFKLELHKFTFNERKKLDGTERNAYDIWFLYKAGATPDTAVDIALTHNRLKAVFGKLTSIFDEYDYNSVTRDCCGSILEYGEPHMFFWLDGFSYALDVLKKTSSEQLRNVIEIIPGFGSLKRFWEVFKTLDRDDFFEHAREIYYSDGRVENILPPKLVLTEVLLMDLSSNHPLEERLEDLEIERDKQYKKWESEYGKIFRTELKK